MVIEEPILSIRLKPTGATGAERKTTVNLKQFSFAANGGSNTARLAEIWLTQDQGDSILTTPSWISPSDESAVEYDISSNAIDTSNSIPIQNIAFEARAELFSSALESAVSLNENTNTVGATGVSDIISLVINNTNGSVDILGALSWEEIF